jgi:glucosamine--fructose-6-phosphate aminotransferase (isomerizing)
MCGIVGILGNKPVADSIVEALRRLEYRGYDSSGVATLVNGGIERRRAVGKLKNLADLLVREPLSGTSGIGHTRWATHGGVTETNAHPHIVDGVVVVHNGIIENFRALKDELAAEGVVFTTQTDTEVVAQLLARALKHGLAPREAVRQVLARLEGAFALAILFKGEDDPMSFSQASAMLIDKGNHRHFMAKEIAEQPEVIGHTLAEYVDFAERTIRVPEKLPFDFATLDRITITACGTASYAGLTAKYWFERVARLPVEVDIASEFRYREAPLPKNGLAIVISQSGETADTLAALRYCKAQGQHTLAIVNVPESTIARESEVVFRTFAGPEIGVASTKAFTCQLTALACLAILAGKQRGTISPDQERELVGALIMAPRYMAEILKEERHIADVARDIATARDVLFLGRGINFPIALEGALKLKEISYIHAEGYAAGELKHGPIALIDENVPVIVIAPHDDLYEKTISNMEEVAARGGKIILITDDQGMKGNGERAFRSIRVPKAHPFISPLLYAVPVQLLAYHAAVIIGTDVDQPRNLAKSVTVE